MTIQQDIPNAYYNDKMVSADLTGVLTAAYNSGYNAGLNNGSASAYHIQIKTDQIYVASETHQQGTTFSRTIYTASGGSGRLSFRATSGYYDKTGTKPNGDPINSWRSVAWAGIYIYNSSGSLKVSYPTNAANGSGGASTGTLREVDLDKGDYVILSGIGPGDAGNCYYVSGSYSYAVVN